jgi:hypothetical protein
VTSTARPSPASPAEAHRAPAGAARPWYRRPTGLAAAAVVLASFALWIYAFSGLARKDPPDTLRDLAYVAEAEARCEPARRAIDALPPAPAARDPQDRAATLSEANDHLAGMLRRLRTVQPDNDADRLIVSGWLADWDRYLADRRSYAATLASGRDAPFTLTGRDGTDYTKSMDHLAEVNPMPSCATPGDV